MKSFTSLLRLSLCLYYKVPGMVTRFETFQAGEAVAHRLDKCRALHQEVLDGESVMDRVRTFAEKIVEATDDAAGTRVDTAELREAYRNTVNASQG